MAYWVRNLSGYMANLAFTRCPGVGNLTLASRKCQNPLGMPAPPPPPTLGLNIDRCISLQFTKVSECQRSSNCRASNSRFSHTFTVNFAVFAPQPRWRQKPWKGLLSIPEIRSRKSLNFQLLFLFDLSAEKGIGFSKLAIVTCGT